MKTSEGLMTSGKELAKANAQMTDVVARLQATTALSCMVVAAVDAVKRYPSPSVEATAARVVAGIVGDAFTAFTKDVGATTEEKPRLSSDGIQRETERGGE